MNEGTEGVTNEGRWELTAPPVHQSGDMAEHQHTANLIAFLPHTDTALFPVVWELVVERLGLVEHSPEHQEPGDTEALAAAMRVIDQEGEGIDPRAAFSRELDGMREDAEWMEAQGTFNAMESAKRVRLRLRRLRDLLAVNQ